MSFFVRFLYCFKASAKMVWEFGEEVDGDGSSGSWDIVWSKRLGSMATTKSPQRGSQKKVAMRAKRKLEGGKGKGERETVGLYQYLRHGPGVYETRAQDTRVSPDLFRLSMTSKSVRCNHAA